MANDLPAPSGSREAPPANQGLVDRVRLLVRQFRALGAVPELCTLAWDLCNENERLLAAQSRESGDRYRWESEAMRIVESVKRELLPAMDEEEGGWLLGQILDLTQKASVAAPVATPAQPETTWYPCACGAEHDTPTCPFGAAPVATEAPQRQDTKDEEFHSRGGKGVGCSSAGSTAASHGAKQ